MIPKIIHYCWFGNNKKSKLTKKCIESWSKICPDFEIKEWNEDNFDVNICEYTKQAYENKKWAFVSDYCRFYVLNKFGGIYLDTDVELLKSPEQFLSSPFAGFEYASSVNTGLIMGCNAGDSLCAAMLREYNSDKFVTDDGELNLKTVCERVTEFLTKDGLILDGTTQKIGGYTIFDRTYFNPMDMNTGKINISENTVSIHHYAASWCSKKDLFRGKIYRTLYRCLGKSFAESVRSKFGKKRKDK